MVWPGVLIPLSVSDVVLRRNSLDQMCRPSLTITLNRAPQHVPGINAATRTPVMVEALPLMTSLIVLLFSELRLEDQSALRGPG